MNPESNTQPLLRVENLTTRFYTDDVISAVDGIEYELSVGDALGIIGESGSGKSVSVRSLVSLIESPGCVDAGEVYWKGNDLLTMSSSELQDIRGAEIAMIFQNAQAAFDPTYTVGDQIIEAIRSHRSVSTNNARGKAIELLEEVGIPSPDERLNQYPHEYSGGMAQRAMIAMSLAADPDLLIADEPTTGLDVSVQAQIIDLFRRLRRTRDMSLILISHDLGVVSQVCERILVMYGGRIVERGTREQLLSSPYHPYTQLFLDSIPDIDHQSDINSIQGSPPRLSDPPSGCRFHPRCPAAEAGLCDTTVPPEILFDGDHRATCHAYTDTYDEHTDQLPRQVAENTVTVQKSDSTQIELNHHETDEQ